MGRGARFAGLPLTRAGFVLRVAEVLRFEDAATEESYCASP